MPFLLPALSAAICDAIVLYLGLHDGSIIDSLEESSQDSMSSQSIYRTRYMILLALLRLFLLVVPLPYHSYTGTAVKCPLTYQLLYGCSIMILLCHMLTLSMLDPNSLSAFVPGVKRRFLGRVESGNEPLSSGSNRRAQQDIWLLLTCSLISNLCHVVLFLHVRSTAPATAEILRRQRARNKVLFYYVKEQREEANGTNSTEDERELLLSNDGHKNNNNHLIDGFAQLSRRDSDSSINRVQRMTSEFMHEIQTRIKKAKEEWTKRLDDYRIRSMQLSGPGGPAGSNQDLRHRPITPFRVLLQLFAYEEVFSNGRLDAVYDQDDGDALMFFVPQLISFLLHGAYDSSPQLEDWLLDTCQRNVYFAHRCYWFLRAWCLESTHDAAVDQSFRRLSRSNSLDGGSFAAAAGDTLGATNAALEDAATGMERLHNSSPSLSSINSHNNGTAGQTDEKLSPEERAVLEGLLVRVVEHAEDPARLLHFGSGPDYLRISELNSDWVVESEGSSQLRGSNPRQATTDELCRNTSSPSALMSLTQAGGIPIDPKTGVPSVKHWDCVAAGNRKFGFLPLDGSLTSATSTTAATRHQSLHPAQLQAENSSSFDNTPMFFDALLTIADKLFKIPREQRTEEFHLQLRDLEVKMLPSNSIYVPVQSDFCHRVWRIVADESIAIHTKERVPCIVCLEVVDYPRSEVPKTHDVRRLLERAAAGESGRKAGLAGSDRGETRQQAQQPHLPLVGAGKRPLPTFLNSSSVNEKELVCRWRYGFRDPHRQDTALEKLAYSISDGIRRIPLDQIKTQMEAHIEKLRHTQNNLHEFLTLQMPDTFSDDDEDQNDGLYQGDALISRQKRKPAAHVNTMESLQRNDIERGDDCFRSSSGTKANDPALSGLQKEQRTAPSFPYKNPPTPPCSPNTAKTSMGQWSPHHVGDCSIDSLGPAANQVDDSQSIPAARGFDESEGNSSPYPRHGRNGKRRQAYGSNGSRRSKSSAAETQNEIHSPVQQQYKLGSSRADCRTPPRTPSRPPPVVFKENWHQKEERLRSSSVYGSHPGWRLVPLLVKANDDLRQEQLASQLIYRMSLILARENVPVWLCPYEILATTDRGGIIEAIPDTISIASLKKNDPNFTSLKDFFFSYFDEVDALADAKANFCESLAAYSMVCFFLQIKDRHNGNILLDNRGHLIHIDFGFFFLSSPGKNTGFESAPFKLTRDFVDLLDGPDSRLFRTFRVLCYRTFITLRRHCMEIILLVEMLKKGNEDLNCFRGRPDDAIEGLRQRFRLDLNDRACMEYVNALVDESLENWRTNWYDRYQRYCVGIL